VANSHVHWSKTGESGTLFGMKLLLLVYRVFGRSGFLFFLFPVMSYYYLFRKKARQASNQYLRQLRPFLSDDQQASLSSFRHFILFGEILLDKLLVWMGHIRREDIVFETPEANQELDSSRKGGIIIVSHLGNFEVGSALASQIPGMRLTILVYTRHAEKFNALMKQVNSNADVEIMQVTDVSPITIMLLSERINSGGYVVIAGDRIPVGEQSRVSIVNFLGRQAPMPQGAFILAGLLKCPVYLMFCLKQQAQYHVYVELFTEYLDFSNRKARLETLNNVVQNYASRLEFYCIKAPMQWFNFYPFWSDNKLQKTNHTSSNEGDIGIS
jgi:predicted LPLAT superfamily acyltransferase